MGRSQNSLGILSVKLKQSNRIVYLCRTINHMFARLCTIDSIPPLTPQPAISPPPHVHPLLRRRVYKLMMELAESCAGKHELPPGRTRAIHHSKLRVIETVPNQHSYMDGEAGANDLLVNLRFP